MRITNLLLCLFVLVLLLIPGGKSAAQTSPIGKFYFVTYEPVTEENQYMGQTATIWEGDASTGTSRHLLDVPPYVNQTPRELYSKSELELLAESKYFPADVLDDTWSVGQGLATFPSS
ncbi:MAG TPA: hypothetical protein VHP83_13795 [Aggregatilineaceae bacterium]|nr:hypothetical protein [Aggregatilineaceae bacterium]